MRFVICFATLFPSSLQNIPRGFTNSPTHGSGLLVLISIHQNGSNASVPNLTAICCSIANWTKWSACIRGWQALLIRWGAIIDLW